VLSMTAVFIFAASWLFTAFAAKQIDGTYTNGHGGKVGAQIGVIVLGALDKFPALIMFIVLTLLAAFFALSISLTVLMKLGAIFKRPESLDTDLGKLK